jgi:twitching motility protein PilT
MTELSPDLRLYGALEIARQRNASDVHLAAGLAPVLRIDGELQRLAETALAAGELSNMSATLLSAHERARLAGEGDVTTSIEHERFGALRLHWYTGGGSIAVAARLLNRRIPPFQTLGLPAAFEPLLEMQRGLLLFGGPTGSGKSTTMASAVDRINERFPLRIVTIEDPIEYRHDSRRAIVTQREIGRDTPELAAALRGALRADPDVIVVGEMRDAEAMSAALTAAETGHLVLATVHTGDAAQTVERIVDVFDGTRQRQVRAQLAQVLVAVVCQRLLRRPGGRGRRAAVELLLATDAVRNLIRGAKTHQIRNAIATGRRWGMQTFEQHLDELLHCGEIEPSEARRFAGAASNEDAA